MSKTKQNNSTVTQLPVKAVYEIRKPLSMIDDYIKDVIVELEIDYKNRTIRITPPGVNSFIFSKAGTSTIKNGFRQIELWSIVGQLIAEASLIGKHLLEEYERNYPEYGDIPRMGSTGDIMDQVLLNLLWQSY